MKDKKGNKKRTYDDFMKNKEDAEMNGDNH